MIRTLKAMLLASMALAVFGALAASSAHAADEERFHCEAEPCKFKALPDEVVNTKTSHHVFIVDNAGESVSFTCDQLSGNGTSAKKTAFELELENIVYGSGAPGACKVNGSTGITVKMNGCKYNFTVTNAFIATGNEDANVTITGCEAGKSIEIVYETGCVATIPAQAPLKGINFHNVPKGELMTVETNIKGITVHFVGTKAQCLITPTGTPEGTYTTGNTFVTGEEDKVGGAMKAVWFE